MVVSVVGTSPAEDAQLFTGSEKWSKQADCYTL